MKTFVATILTDSNSTGKPWKPQFEESCIKYGIDFVKLPITEYSPVNGDTKLRALASLCISRRDTYDHVLYVDAFDSVFTGGLSEIEARFESVGSQMVVSGCAALLNKISDERQFPMAESCSPFRFPCSGVFMAEISHFLRLASAFGLCESTGPFADGEWFQHVITASPSAFSIDTDGKLFLTLSGSSSDSYTVNGGALVVTTTQQAPLVVHGGPRFDLRPILVEMGYFGALQLEGVSHPVTLRRRVSQASFRESSRARRTWLEDYRAAWTSSTVEFSNVVAYDEISSFVESHLPSLCKISVDFGAGDGRLTNVLARHSQTVLAIDLDIDKLKRLAKTSPSVRIEELKGPVISSARSGSVQFVLAWDVLSYVDFYDLTAILREFSRITDREGVVVANFVDLKSPHNAGFINSVHPAYGPSRIRPYTDETLQFVFREAGFECDVKSYGKHHLVVVARNAAVAKNDEAENSQRTFYHSGDAGDIVYALLTVKAMGGGKLYIGADPHIKYDVKTRVRLTPEAFANLEDLVRSQPYISGCSYADVFPEGAIDVNLNEFRIWLIDHQTGNYWNNADYAETLSLARVHLRVFGIDSVDETEPWLTASPVEVQGRPIAVARSLRYNNVRFPWKDITERYSSKMFFVGTDDEYKRWRGLAEPVSEVPHVLTKTLAEVASYIAGAKLFIGNQSCPGAIAEGLKMPLVQESWDHDPNCMFARPNALYQNESVVDILKFMSVFLQA